MILHTVLICSLIGSGALRSSPDSRPFPDDPRMQQKLTIHAAGLPMREILADISARTGIKLTASAKVAEDKAVLFVRDRPLASTLDRLAKFFNFMWESEGKKGEYAYILTQSINQERAELEEMDRKAFRTAEQIVKEAKRCQPYMEMSAEEVQ